MDVFLKSVIEIYLNELEKRRELISWQTYQNSGLGILFFLDDSKETRNPRKEIFFPPPTNVQLEMVERVSNVALQWRLMNFFRESSQPKTHSLSLNESIFGVWPTSSCPLGPMSTPDKLLTSSSRSPAPL